MKKLTFLSYFLEENGGYTNHHNVTIALGEGGIIKTYCTYPGIDNSKEYISLELCSTHKSVIIFESFFSINSVQDLENITPEHFLEQYNNDEGNIEVFCEIDEKHFGGALRFRKNKNDLFAADDVTEKYHQVSHLIRDPEDFIKYTCKYFLLAPSFPIGNAETRKN